MGDLWTACGPEVFISHDGLLAMPYTHNGLLHLCILTKTEITPAKLAAAYFKNRLEFNLKIYFSGPKKQPQARLGRGVVGMVRC